jgi:hypothetical protein
LIATVWLSSTASRARAARAVDAVMLQFGPGFVKRLGDHPGFVGVEAGL